MTMQIIEEGPRNLVVRFYDLGANTVTVAGLNPPCQDLRVTEVIYDSPAAPAAGSSIAGEATVNLALVNLGGHSDTLKWDHVSGLVNNAGVGKTGNIVVTVGDALTSIVVTFKKVRHTTVYN